MVGLDGRKGTAKATGSGWYHHPVVAQMRQFLRGKFFTGVMMIGLFGALFLPDIHTLAGVNSNFEQNIALTIIMFLFAFEFLGLTVSDPSYLFGFFFWMDFVGTLSMAWDISFLAGFDVTKRVYASGGDAKKNLMLLRAARAAKLGARAGRLSRVLKIIRFLPFMRNQDKSEVAMARVISNKLSNLLSTRVACLTIILVVILPIFGLVTYPEDDFSMRSWVERLSEIKKDEAAALQANDSWAVEESKRTFLQEAKELSKFYEVLAYGPYMLCTGKMGEEAFDCDHEVQGWNPTYTEPTRGITTLVIHTNTFMAAFDMSAPIELEAGLSMLLILFVICVMAFAGMALSNVVDDLAVKPMERMLSTVRTIAKTIFKMGPVDEEQANDDEDEELDGLEQATEMQLLEKVVSKLTSLAELSTKKQPEFDKENMGAEDLGVLHMMGGQETEASDVGIRKSFGNASLKRQMTFAMKVDEVGVSMDTWQSWLFNPALLTKEQQKSLIGWTIFNHQGCSSLARAMVPDAKAQTFVTATESSYLPNPYHNFAHVVDVLHTVCRILKITHSELFLSELEQFSVVVAAIAHDMGHPGVNNPFLIEASHELALRYNDKSPLENMHCAKLFTLCSLPDSNIFMNLPKDQFKEIRKNCIEMILHTDMVVHFAMVKDLTMLYQMNSEMFDATDLDALPDLQEAELF
jgi:cyclophilin family peptidyl-prolyl cis-trans isomerase